MSTADVCAHGSVPGNLGEAVPLGEACQHQPVCASSWQEVFDAPDCPVCGEPLFFPTWRETEDTGEHDGEQDGWFCLECQTYSNMEGEETGDGKQ